MKIGACNFLVQKNWIVDSNQSCMTGYSFCNTSSFFIEYDMHCYVTYIVTSILQRVSLLSPLSLFMIDVDLSKFYSLLRDNEVSQAEEDGVRTASGSQ
jgi:hypothetical protein